MEFSSSQSFLVSSYRLRFVHRFDGIVVAWNVETVGKDKYEAFKHAVRALENIYRAERRDLPIELLRRYGHVVRCRMENFKFENSYPRIKVRFVL